MMSGGDERWPNGSGGAPQGALNHLLERINNDFTPQHDSHHFQPGFVPSAAPPPWPQAQVPLTSLGTPLQPPHANMAPQVPPMQAPHMGPQMAPLQPPTTSASCGMPLGAQLSGSAGRNFSAGQDLFSDLSGRNPLLRSSSDLGLRIEHFPQGAAYRDVRMDGYMEGGVDPMDVMIVENSEMGFFPEVQHAPPTHSGTPPPLQPDAAQNMQNPGVRPQEFSFYSSGRDRMEDVGLNNFSAKFSNFTASLGSWFNPIDPFRSNLTAEQTNNAEETLAPPAPPAPQMAPVNTEVRKPPQNAKIPSPPAASQPVKVSKPSYSDVLSKNTTVGASSNSRSNYPPQSPSPGASSTHPPHSSSPAPTTTRPEHQNHNHQSIKGKNRNSNSGSSSSGGGSTASHNQRHHNKSESSYSRVGLDDFDLNEGSIITNGRISAYEHYDWGERIDLTLNTKTTASSPTHQAKKGPKGDKKCTPEKTPAPVDQEPVILNDTLNNKVNSTHQKPPQRRASYINNNLNANTPSAGGAAIQEGKAAPTTAAEVGNNNNNDLARDINKAKGAAPKDDRRAFEHGGPSSASSNSRTSSRKQESRCSDKFERKQESRNKQAATKKRKGPTFAESELVVAGWAVVVQWAGLVMQAVVWLGTLAADVVVMSYRLSLHMLAGAWARVLVAAVALKHAAKHYWTKWLAMFWNPDKKEKKLAGRGEKKANRGLDCNISLPTTGDEAMKRLLACKGKDPYSILGVTQDCTNDDIKKYYKRQAFLVHPDKNKQPGAEEAFKILAHAFEIIGEPERRRTYDASVLEEVQLEGAWGELASLLTRLQEKLDEAANTIRCTNCNKRHRRTKLAKPIYAARHCAECQIHHAAREGDIWAESSFLGLRWKYLACMEGAVYDISEWAACQSDNLKHLQADTHSVQYRIVSGKRNPPTRRQTPEFPSDPDLEEFFNNLCKEKFGKTYPSGGGQTSGQQMPDMRKRKGKKKK